MIQLVLVLLACAIVVPLLIAITRDPNRLRKGYLSTAQLGRFEGSLRDLKSVVVVCHQIEDPQDALRRAVRENFRRNVKYSFLVSQSRAKDERHVGYRLFEVIAERAIMEDRKSLSLGDLVEIQGLPYDWDDAPYIFYELGVPDEPTTRRIVAVRGNQKRQGIANGYLTLDPRFAKTILRATLAGAPVSLDADSVVDVRFGDDTGVRSLQRKIERAGGLTHGS